MTTFAVTNVQVILPDRISDCDAVVVKDSRIEAVLPEKDLPRDGLDAVVDGEGGYLSPGYIDLHIHGLHGYGLDIGPQDLQRVCADLPKYGVTGFLPTLIPKPKGEDAAFVRSLAGCQTTGAEVLGFHLEGPFIALPGGIDPRALGRADPDRVCRLIEAAEPHPAIFSTSPDFEGILDLIPIMSRNGAPVFVTHTQATVQQTEAAIEAGACHATHFYDVFPCPPEIDRGVRPCGSVEAILADPRVSVDFILDGEHVDPVAVKMALRCKGPEAVCLATDANLGAGLPAGKRLEFHTYHVIHHYDGGPARMTHDSPMPNCLAGSGLTMDRAVRNAVRMLDVDLPTAIRMASTSPARVLGLSRKKGRVEAGYDADLVLLDEQLRVRQTWVSGICRYRAS